MRLPVVSASAAPSPSPPRQPEPPPASIVIHRGWEDGFAPGVDGTQLYWRVDGRSGPWLVFNNGLGVSTFFWDPLRDALSKSYRVLTWDYRGHGRSGPAPRRGFGIGTCADDLGVLMERLKVDRAVLFGHSMGSQVVLEAKRRHPARVAGLVSVLGGYGKTVQTFFDNPATLELLKVARAAYEAKPSFAQMLVRRVAKLPLSFDVAKLMGIVHPDLCRRGDMVAYMEHLSRLDLNVYFQLAQDLQDHDASDVLRSLDVPLLIVAGDRDKFTPHHISERMQALAAGSELFVIRGGSHAALIEQPELVELRVERFLVEKLGYPKLPPKKAVERVVSGH